MATLFDVYRAYENAKAAGDSEAADKLAQFIASNMESRTPQAAPPSEPSVGRSFQRGLETYLSSLGVTGGALLGDKEEAALRGLERGEATAELYGEGASFRRVQEAYDQDGILSAIGTAVKQTPAAVAEQVPQLASTIAMAKLGAMAGAPFGGPAGATVGGGLGALLSVFPQLAGQNIMRQAEVQQAEEAPVDIDLTKAMGTAAVQAVPELLGTYVTFGKSFVRSLLGLGSKADLDKTAARELTGAARRTLMAQAERASGKPVASLAGEIGRGAARGAAIEMPTELAQQVLERAQAGLDVFSDDAFAEYGEALYLGGTVGAVFGGTTGPSARSAKMRRGEEILEQEAQDLAAARRQELDLGGQQELPGFEPVAEPTTRAGQAQAERAVAQRSADEEYFTRGDDFRVAPVGTFAPTELPSVVRDQDVFDYMKSRGLTTATTLEVLPSTERQAFEAIKAQTNEAVLVELAAAEAARVPRAEGEAPLVIDPNKSISEFTPEELDVLDRVIAQRTGGTRSLGKGKGQQRLPKALTDILVGERATQAKSEEAEQQQKQAEREAGKAQAAAAKLNAQRAKAIQDPRRQQALELGEPIDLVRPVPEDAGVSAADGQIDLFAPTSDTTQQPQPTAVIPSDKDALRVWAKNTFGIAPTANLFTPGKPNYIGGKDLSDPVQAAEVKAHLEKYVTKNSPPSNENMDNILRKVNDFLQRPEFQTQTEEGVDVVGETAPKPKAKSYTEEDFFGEGVSEMEGAQSLAAFLEREPNNTSLHKIAADMVSFLDAGPKAVLLQAVKKVSGPHHLINAAASPKLEGDLLAAVQAGDLKKTISLLVGKMGGRPEAQQILRKIQSLNLKTKIVVGVVPGSETALPMFAGPQALSADIAGLADAQQLLADGRSANDVRIETGWFKGPDNKWRFEITDDGASLKTPINELTESPLFGKPTVYKLSDVLDHPALYAAYPDAANIEFIVRKGFMDFGGLQGSYDGANRIQVTPYAKNPESTLLHEVQHWVQNREGFAMGGNANSVVDAIMSTAEAQKIAGVVLQETSETLQFLARVEELLTKTKQRHPGGTSSAREAAAALRAYSGERTLANPEYEALIKESNRTKDSLRAILLGGKRFFDFKSPEWKVYSELTEPNENATNKRRSEHTKLLQTVASIRSGDADALRKVIKDSGQAYNLYRRLAGEAEARNTQARQKLTQAERRMSPISSTMDVSEDSVIVVMSGEDVGTKPLSQGDLMYAEQKAGAYDPVTDTITLDPELGLNEHTLIHELAHAALANQIANPKTKVSKDFRKFFQLVKNQIGDAYGATNVQEFAAELMGNEQFAASLKSMKAPKGLNLWQKIVQTLAEFFEFRKPQSVYDAGIKYINELLNVPPDAKAPPSAVLFMGTPKEASQALREAGTIGRAPASRDNIARTLEQLNEQASKKGEGVANWARRTAFKLLRPQNILKLYEGAETKYRAFTRPFKQLMDAAEGRQGFIETVTDETNRRYMKFKKVFKKNPQLAKRLFSVAEKARIAGVDLLPDSKFQPSAQQASIYAELQRELDAMPSEFREAYFSMRRDYDRMFTQYRDMMLEQYTDNVPLREEMRRKFEAEHPVAGYIPFVRYGDYVLEYTDPQLQRRVVRQFEAASERDAALRELGLEEGEYQMYLRMEDVAYNRNRVPATSFLRAVMDDFEKGGASQAQLNSIYQTYLSMFPAESIAKRMMQSDNVLGASNDMLRAYSNTMLQWARHMANAKYTPQIDDALDKLRKLGASTGTGRPLADQDPNIKAIVDNYTSPQAVEFLHNPTYKGWVANTSAVSYNAFILGNVASAVINLTSLPLLAYPILAGRFGHGRATAELISAIRLVTPIALSDTPGSDQVWSKVPQKYQRLFRKLMDQGQLQHTQAREMLEGRRKNIEEYTSPVAKVMEYGNLPFSMTEKVSRAATAIAAYELALKGGGGVNAMSPAQAIEYALNAVKEVNTSGIAATGPMLFQSDLGRMFGTFKTFMWNASFVTAKAGYDAFRSDDAQTRIMARRQILATLVSSTALTGASGVPFFGGMVAATNAIMNGLRALTGDDDDEELEYYSKDEWMLDTFGELGNKGLLNYFLNLSIADRAAFTGNLLFREDPKLIEDVGYVRAYILQALGPSVAYAANVADGLQTAYEGDMVRGLEQILPSGLGNVFRGYRFIRDEGALTKNGKVIDDDISTYNIVMQMVGVAPADLALKYTERSQAMQVQNKITKRKSDLLTLAWAAQQSGDTETYDKAREALVEFGRKYPGEVDGSTLARSFRGRQQDIQESVAGLRLNPNLRQKLLKRFETLED